MSNNFLPLTVDELVNRINKIPKVNLAILPTPLEYLPNISKDLEINLYVKRDDCTALAFGGNKTRHLEFLMAKVKFGGRNGGGGLEFTLAISEVRIAE